MKKMALLALLGLSGCTNQAALQVKKDILNDLNGIVANGADCPTICDALKAYIQSKLAQIQ